MHKLMQETEIISYVIITHYFHAKLIYFGPTGQLVIHYALR